MKLFILFFILCMLVLNTGCNSDDSKATEDSNKLSSTTNYDLSIKLSNSPALGSVSILPGNINCTSNCSHSIEKNSSVTITAKPNNDSIFRNWSNDCGTKTECTFLLDENKSIEAIFSLKSPRNLSLTINSTEGGQILFKDKLYSCTKSCTFEILEGEQLHISTQAATGMVFEGWQGVCEGQNKCVFSTRDDLTLTAMFIPEKSLTSFSVKESASVGTHDYPVSMVFPVEYGKYHDVNNFYITDSAGQIVPAQFEILNRWWGKDNSLRHIQAHFQTTLLPYTVGSPQSGVNKYNLLVGALNSQPEHPVSIEETAKIIKIHNDVINIEIDKKPLKIKTPAGNLTSIFVKENGDIDHSFSHETIAFEIEEDGPLRSTLKISSPTIYNSPTDIKHGWALRIYAYANSSLVKVDFQLQNSAINTAISAPLYFKSHTLQFDNAKTTTNEKVRANYMPLEDIESLPLGKISSDNVHVMLRNFWQTFPNGLSTQEDNILKIELWPEWSKQFYDDHFVEPNIYWLDDMKQTYKEILLDFSTIKTAEVVGKIAATFQYSPVTVVPQEYYAKTRVTLELGGYFPFTPPPAEHTRTLTYDDHYYDISSYGGYKFGMDNFGLDTDRKHKTNTTGGWAYSSLQYLISGNPKDYFNAQNKAISDINIRPQWLSGYKHERDFERLTPSTNPYGGSSWRMFKGHNAPTQTREYIENTDKAAFPRDDHHAWFYHIEHAYLMSGNKWIKDWYEFISEFKKIYLSESDPFPSIALRSEGQAISLSVAAYKYTGNQSLKPFLKNYVAEVHSKYLTSPHNIKGLKNPPSIAGFQLGYLLRGLIELYNEYPESQATLDVIRNSVNWNYQYGKFSYYKSISDHEAAIRASGSSLTLVDPVIWFSIKTKEPKYAQQAIQFVEEGIGGKKAYGKWKNWTGQFESSLYNYYKQNQ